MDLTMNVEYVIGGTVKAGYLTVRPWWPYTHAFAIIDKAEQCVIHFTNCTVKKLGETVRVTIPIEGTVVEDTRVVDRF